MLLLKAGRTRRNSDPSQSVVYEVLQQLIERIDTAAKINKICAEHMEGHVQHKDRVRTMCWIGLCRGLLYTCRPCLGIHICGVRCDGV